MRNVFSALALLLLCLCGLAIAAGIACGSFYVLAKHAGTIPPAALCGILALATLAGIAACAFAHAGITTCDEFLTDMRDAQRDRERFARRASLRRTP